MQEKTLKDVLSEILAIIQYPENKRADYIEEFMLMNVLEAMTNFAEKLPEDKKAELKTKTNYSPEELEALKQFFPAEEFQTEVERIAKEELRKVVEVLPPDVNLSVDQKQKIDQLLNSIPVAATPAVPVTPDVAPAPVAPVTPTPDLAPAAPVVPATPPVEPTQ